MRLVLACAGAAVCLLVSQAATAAALDGSAPAERLARIADAARTATYQGVLVYRGDEKFEVLRLQHRFRDGSERERMDSLTGAPIQLLRFDNRLVCILPKDRAVSLDRPALKGLLSQLTAERVKELEKWYQFRDLGGGRIAGRSCSGVAVLPRDEYRYGYEVWADQETGVPLKLGLLGVRGEMLEQIMFTEVSYPDSIADEVFETDVDTSRQNLITRDLPNLDAPPHPPDADRPQVAFDQLPPGFRVVAREQKPIGGGQGTLEHLLLSDGLSAVSVFSAVQQPVAAPDHGFRGVSHVGPVQAYGRMIGAYHVTIVGEVPVQTLRMIGDGAHPMFPVGAGDDAAPKGEIQPR